MKDRGGQRHASAGFSLVELLVVVAIIAIMAMVMLPNLAGYIRNYKINGAASAVAGEIQAARAKAIQRNVNLGVVFLIVSPSQYRYVLEDTNPPTAVRPSLTTLLDPANTQYAAQRGPVRELPSQITFGMTCTGFTSPYNSGIRFTRLGSWCNPAGSAEPCPGLGTGSATMMNTATDATVCLEQGTLKKTVTVAVGGRVQVK